jgi:hypothetical protein
MDGGSSLEHARAHARAARQKAAMYAPLSLDGPYHDPDPSKRVNALDATRNALDVAELCLRTLIDYRLANAGQLCSESDTMTNLLAAFPLLYKNTDGFSGIQVLLSKYIVPVIYARAIYNTHVSIVEARWAVMAATVLEGWTQAVVADNDPDFRTKWGLPPKPLGK